MAIQTLQQCLVNHAVTFDDLLVHGTCQPCKHYSNSIVNMFLRKQKATNPDKARSKPQFAFHLVTACYVLALAFYSDYGLPVNLTGKVNHVWTVGGWVIRLVVPFVVVWPFGRSYCCDRPIIAGLGEKSSKFC